jgi:hypothetical protein
MDRGGAVCGGVVDYETYVGYRYLKMLYTYIHRTRVPAASSRQVPGTVLAIAGRNYSTTPLKLVVGMP